MRDFCIIVFLLVFFSTCNGQEAKEVTNGDPNLSEEFASYGRKINRDSFVSDRVMLEKYNKMETSDTIASKFTAKVADVCQVKGCWMKLQLEDGAQAMVRFKDYSFFMPKNSVGKTVIVNGLAFVEEMTVADQRHYAKDAGLSEIEVAKITSPKKTFGFEADGVLLKKE